jgi:hypothetical protein
MTKRAKRKDLFGEILTQIREEAGMTTAEAPDGYPQAAE